MYRVFEIFSYICKVPHCSGKCEKMMEYIVSFAKNNGCKVATDKAGNILCQKGNPKICLQSHYDMVCLGRAPKIDIYEEDGYLKAKESTLGADNGIGMAIMLYVMEKYGDLEFLFTADEEIGLVGASKIELKIKSSNFLNLDSEEEGDIFIGCAGGVEIFAEKTVELELVKKESDFYKISTKDLKGGHSGIDIDKNIKNAIKELAWFLSDFQADIIEISGGEANNSIPKDAYAIIALKKGIKIPPAKSNIDIEKIDGEFGYIIKNSDKITDILNGFAHGVREFDKEMGIPKTSINLASVKTDGGKVKLEFFARSNFDDSLKRLMSETASYMKSHDFNVCFNNEFPAWKPEINEFGKKIKEISKEYFANPAFKAVHAGLECGVLLKRVGENIRAASIGPNIYYPHSEEEKCEMESVKRVAKAVERLIESL